MKKELTLNGKTYEVEFEYAEPMLMDEFKRFASVSVAPTAPAATPAVAQNIQNTVVSGEGEPVPAPMPGTIVKVNVNVGDNIASGTVLCVLEAMKMENEITAPRAGTVKQVLISQGASVDTGSVLVVLN